MPEVPSFKTPLCQIAFWYGSDKCPQIKHHYTEWYYPFFAGRREAIRKLLEIGVGDQEEMRWTGVPNYTTGASLHMWRDFFPNAQVYGADVKPSCMFKAERIETFLCDQAREEDLRRLIEQTGSDLDVVVDDGSHKPVDQVLTCKIMMPLLQQDVIYIIEDVGRSEIAAQLTDYACEFINPWRRRNRDDRILLVRNKNGKS